MADLPHNFALQSLPTERSKGDVEELGWKESDATPPLWGRST